MAIEEYYVDQPVKFQGFFFSDAERKNPTDTATQLLTIKPPKGADVTYNTPTRDSLGEYSQVHVPGIAGDWHYRWDTTSPDCVIQGLITVSERNV